MMDNEDDKLVAIIGSGILSPIFDRVDIRQERRRLTDLQFDALVQDLFDRGLIASDAIECKFSH